MTGFQSKRGMAQAKTSMKDEALKLALEALQFALHIGFPESSESQIKKGEKAYQQHRAAITAIKEALAQPVQEPVYVYTCQGCEALYWEDDMSCDCTVDGLMKFTRHILMPDTTPPLPEERNFCPRCGKRTADIHTCTPPQENT